MRIFKHRIFLSLLAGKFTTIEQMLLTEWININGACVIAAPVFFLSFLAGKLKMFKLPITRDEPTEKTFQIVHEITFAYFWL